MELDALSAGIKITEFGLRSREIRERVTARNADRNDADDSGAPRQRLSSLSRRYSNGRFVTASGVISSMKRADVTNVVSLTSPVPFFLSRRCQLIR